MEKELYKSKKVSIVMPVFNGEKYLEKAIDSIRNQSYKNWELIVINDGSTDNSEKIIHQYADSRIRYFKNETNCGLTKTLNKSLSLCEGEYIARMDADDISSKNRLQKQVHFLEKNSDFAMCGTNATVIDGEGKTTGNITNVGSNDYLQINLLFSVPIVHPSVMARASVLKKYQYSENYDHTEDYELWQRIASDNKIANLAPRLIKYRWHSSNISQQYNQQQEELKSKIIRKQLSAFGLKPNSKELRLHRITFMQYGVDNSTEIKSFDEYKELSNWFAKLIEANSRVKKYDQKKLIAFLWSRWIVLCVKQKKYGKIFKADFVKFDFSVYFEVTKLIAVLSKK